MGLPGGSAALAALVEQRLLRGPASGTG
jgi:hypothetical protein